MTNRLSPKKHGFVTIYIGREIDKNLWVRQLGGETTKTVLKRTRKGIAKRLKRRLNEIHYAPYNDGWIFLCDGTRVVWETRKFKGKRTGWTPGEPWVVEHGDLHTDTGVYDE